MLALVPGMLPTIFEELKLINCKFDLNDCKVKKIIFSDLVKICKCPSAFIYNNAQVRVHSKSLIQLEQQQHSLGSFCANKLNNTDVCDGG